MKKIQLLALRAQIQAAISSSMILREYDAPWLVNTTKITRDAGGRFASRATSTIPAPSGNQDAIANLGIDVEKLSQRLQAEQKSRVPPEDVPELYEKIAENQAKAMELAYDAQAFANNPEVADWIRIPLISSANKAIVQLNNENQELEAKIYQAKGKGFSLQKRVNELVDIAKKEGQDSPRYKWRKMVIDAELEYGDLLDNVAKDGNKKLIKKLQKSNAPKAIYDDVSDNDKTSLQADLENLMGGSVTPPNEVPGLLRDAKNAGGELQKLLQYQIDVRIGMLASRSCAIAGSKSTNAETLEEASPDIKNLNFWQEGASGLINLGDVTTEMFGLKVYGQDLLADRKNHIKEIVWHETGHLIEYNCDFLEASYAFREDRGKETLPKDKIPAPPGMGNVTQDRFYSPYVGLKYQYKGKDVGSEVLSSGLEALASDDLIKRVATVDRENLLYAIGALDNAK